MSARAVAQPDPAANGPAGAALSGLLRAIDSGDSAAIHAFAAERYDARHLDDSGGPPRAVQRWLEIHQVYGPLEVDSVVEAGAHQVRAWVRGRLTRAWLDFLVAVDSAPPHRIVRVRLGRGLRPAHAALRRPELRAGDLPGHLAAYLDGLAREDHFSGVVLVAIEGRTVFERAYGLADRERGEANAADTRFDLGSVGKVLTAVAVMQLAEQGKLSLDDPVSRHVPALPRSVADRVTVRQLLSHSSGLGELGPALDSALSVARTVPEMVALLTDTALAFPPGTGFAYSNRGYLVLGAVIEGASGQDYFAYLREKVFAPAGIDRTGFFPQDSAVPGRAARYTRFPGLRSGFVPGPRRSTSVRLDWRGGPAGGVYSTAGDLAHFVRALQEGRLLGAASLAEMTRVRGEHPWGYGFQLMAPRGSYGHRGGA
ncbi:MAG TPA: serine hydrolase domain-containing protein, partial [Longimicrobiaceae bacterium]|nr:serine hydrolase domain-containing protein [Longimicrobiaceae bacterium]